MSNQYTTSAPFPPTTTTLGESASGTITGIYCAGPCVCTIYSAAGVALHSISTQRGVGSAIEAEVVSIAFSGGAPTVTQTTPSSIVFTI